MTRLLIVITFALLLAPPPAFAQQRPAKLAVPTVERIGAPRTGSHVRRPAAAGKPSPATSTGSDIVAHIQGVALADLEAASSDAKATADTVAAPCYDAWIALIEAQQKAQANPMPDPHVITAFQRARDLVNALRAGSPLKTACAPLAEELKQDVLDLLGKVATGVITINTLLPVIP